jgi:hypothetical protein
MTFDGATQPKRGWFHRSSASQPMIRPLAISTFGW